MREVNKLISLLYKTARTLSDIKAWYYLLTGKPDKWLRRMKNKFIGRQLGRFY